MTFRYEKFQYLALEAVFCVEYCIYIETYDIFRYSIVR